MKVGDYVRTKNKGVKKIIALYSNAIFDGQSRIEENQIIKSSPNIIDLIEVGDYVNGERVINIIKKHKYLEVSDEEIVIDEKDIKSIVTKQQFEQIEYRIGE